MTSTSSASPSSSTKSPTKKPGLLSRLFSMERKSSFIPTADDGDDFDGDVTTPLTSPSAADEKLRQQRKRLQRLHSMDATTFRDRTAVLDGFDSGRKSGGSRRHGHSTSSSTSSTSSSAATSPTSPTSPTSESGGQRPHSGGGGGSRVAQQPKSLSARKQSMPAVMLSTDVGRRSSADRIAADHAPRSPQTAPPSTLAVNGPAFPASSSSPSPTTPPPPVNGSAPNQARKKSLPVAVRQTSKEGGQSEGGRERQQRANGRKKLRHRKARSKTTTGGTKVDTSVPLEFPATPETLYEYHRQKPFLNNNEEWLVVELNEYECLIDSIEIIKIIAKHSKFFEVEPDQLWEEFFEFVEDVPSYDEIINYDVWQEFRDMRYPC